MNWPGRSLPTCWATIGEQLPVGSRFMKSDFNLQLMEHIDALHQERGPELPSTQRTILPPAQEHLRS
ncbi:MAG: hypothetical protein CMM01_14380 [Rhodopirellula sp.]|nr:hypothetical protein [Rhodopirellula sp.]